jgi:thioredoxin 1
MFMKARILVPFLTLVATALACRAAVPDGWSTNYTNTLGEAEASQRATLVFFTASWCGPCQMMTRTTLTNSGVLSLLKNLGYVAIDIDDQPELASQYNVRAGPTFVLISVGGDEVERTTGYEGAEDFTNWLTNGVAEAGAAVIRLNRERELLTATDLLLSTNTPDSARQAAGNLFDLCVEKDSTIAPAALTRLKTLAARQPTVVLEGLLHPRLAARIQAGNALRASLGDDFDVDPWSEPAERQQAVEKWRARLAPVGKNN